MPTFHSTTAAGGAERRDQHWSLPRAALSLHDIPAQARRMFVLNPLRLILAMSPIAPYLGPDRQPLTGAHVDLSQRFCQRLAIHCDTRNMAVHGSMACRRRAGMMWGMSVSPLCAL